MNIVLLLLVFTATPVVSDTSHDPKVVCEAASMVLRDMRYFQGKYAAPGDFSRIRKRLASCESLVALARPFGLRLMVGVGAVAYNEGNFREGLVGAAGEEGKMQVMYKHHCKGVLDLDNGKGHCTNPERAGVRALRLILAKSTSRFCITQEVRWIRSDRQRRRVVGKSTVLRPTREHAALVCALARYNGSRRYGRKVAAMALSIERRYLKMTATLPTPTLATLP